MKIPNNLRPGEATFNMTPMIDVVFQLIIFFLVSSHLAKQEAQMELPLPVADSGVEPTGDPTPRITINVLNDGSMILAGHPVRKDDLVQRLKKRLAAEGGNLEVRIRSDRMTPYRNVEPIMLACARSGIWNVQFAVYRSEDVR
jgi:biopolymer transport protein ExbD